MREILSVVPKLPGVRVFEFSDSVAKSQELATFCEEEGHYLEIATFDEQLYQRLQNLNVKVRLLHEAKERYNQRSMQFDTIFIDYDIRRLEDVENFFKKIYRMTKNAGDILFEIDQNEVEAMSDLLERCNFVAINTIPADGKLYLSAKRMHGWTRV